MLQAEGSKLAELRRQRGIPVFGTNTSVEKGYLRLTSLPSVDAVRPPAVLRQALERVKARWLQVLARSAGRSWHRMCVPGA